MARAMVGFLASLLGHVRGGLSYVLVGAMYLVSGISGSKAADMAAVAPVLFPEMKQARRQARRSGGAAVRDRRADRNHSAEPGADHDRLGDRRVDRGAVHRRPAARRRARAHALLRGLVALPPRRPLQRASAPRRARSDGPADRAAGPRAAVRDPRGGGRGRGDRDRSLDHRHRLHGARRPADLPPVRLAAAAIRCWSRPRRCPARSCSSSVPRPPWPGR